MSAAANNAPVRLGATCEPGVGAWFAVWAPRPRRIELALEGRAPIPAERDSEGYARWFVPGVGPGARYRFQLTRGDGERVLRPDPASRFQPEGVHGPSQVTVPCPAASFQGPEWRDYIFYELHVGTFSLEGTFAGVAGDLPRLRRLGVSAIELMPVAQFPGTRNWGYDGTYPFAAQNSYGGPEELHTLTGAIHAQGMAATLDVVYNHLGPEGNYLGEFGPYFTRKYATPWGDALNFDGADSGPVRRYFLENALYWLDEIGFDALRLDAVHGIFDFSARPFLAELADRVEDLARRRRRRLYLVAESDRNDVAVLRPTAAGGLGMRAQWSDDFHHALHARLTGERQGYYADFGSAAALAAALRENYVFSGQYSRYRRRRHGNSARGFAPDRFVVFAQNHDQVGNRAAGDRLAQTLGHLAPQPTSGFATQAALRLAAGIVLLAPATPLLFMGEEFGAVTPFPYFVSHGDPELVAAVRRGRAAEFAAFAWQGELPDPQAEATFLGARLRRPEPGAVTPAGTSAATSAKGLEAWYRALIHLRRDVRVQQADGAPAEVWSTEEPPVITWRPGPRYLVLAHLGSETMAVEIPWPMGAWQRVLDSTPWPREPEPATLAGDGASVSVAVAPFAFQVWRAAK